MTLALLLLLGDVHAGEDATLELGGQAGNGRVLEIDATRGAPLAGLLVEVVLALLLIGLLALDGDGEAALVELDVDLLTLDSGELRGDDVLVARVLDVHLEARAAVELSGAKGASKKRSSASNGQVRSARVQRS